MAKQQNCHMPGLSYAVFMSFGQRIKNRRGDLRMTGDDLGRRISPPVSKQTIAHWEADRYRPHVDQVAQLCLILGMSADTLVLGVGDAPSPRAAEIAALYDAATQTDKARIEMMLQAMALGAASSEVGTSTGAGKHPEIATNVKNATVQTQSDTMKFGPALKAAFSFNRDVSANGESVKAAAAPKKRRGSNS